MSQEVIEKMENIAKGIKEYQDDTVKNKDAISELTKSLEDMQNDKLVVKELGQKFDSIDKKLGRLGTSSVDKDEKLLEQKSAINKYLRYRDPISEELTTEITKSLITNKAVGMRDDTLEREVKSIVVGSNPEGGYLLRPEYSNKNITRLWETSPIRSIANVMTSASGSMEFLIDDDEAATGGWVGEVDERSDSGTPTFGAETIYTHEQYAEPRISQKALDDIATDLESLLQTKVVQRFVREENSAFVSGNDVKKPKGFLTYPAWTTKGVYERNALEQINSGSAGNVTADSLKKLQNSLYEGYQSNAVWVMNRETFGEITRLKDGQSRYLLDTNSFKNGDTPILLGKPVIFASDMPIPATNSLSVAYGDFMEGYTILDGIGVRVIRDPYTKKGFVKYYVTKQTGGKVTNFQSIKILKLAA